MTKTQKKQYETLWAFMEAQKGLVYQLITEVLNSFGLFHIDKDEIYQELATELVKLIPGREWRTIKNRIKIIVRRELERNRRIEFYLEQIREIEDNEDASLTAYVNSHSVAAIDRIQVEDISTAIEDDTIEEVREFINMFGAEYRAIIKLKMLGYNKREIAVRLKRGLDKIQEAIENIKLAACIYFNVDKEGITYTFDD